MDPDRFQIPEPPPGLVFPLQPQYDATLIMWFVASFFVAYSLLNGLRTRNPLAPLLILGGIISYLNEPIVDILGLCWHPRIGQWVALRTFGPVPLWGVGIYVIFFGAMPYVIIGLAQRGISRKAFLIGILAFFVLDLACEMPMLHYGLYSYYGKPPMLISGFPLYWLFINTSGPLIDVAILLRARSFFTGWRLLLVPLLPMTTDAMGSIASGWPIFTALNTPDASSALKWIAAIATIILGATIMDGLSRVICTKAASTIESSRVSADVSVRGVRAG